MKPAAFDYYAPTTVDEVVQLLGSMDDAKVLAGGQSLVPLLSMRLAQPAALIDINRIPELAYIRRDNGDVAVGAMTRQRDLGLNPVAGAAVPPLRQVIGRIGHVTIRHRGTVGGSIAHADPAAELPMAAVTLDASIVAQGPRGTRSIAARDLFTTYLTTSLAPDEIVTEIRFPVLALGTRYALEELARRHGDFALSAVLAVIEMDADGRITSARIGVAGANPVPLRATAAESVLIGQAASDSAIGAAAEEVARAVSPISDVHASADYRRQVTRILAARAVRRATTSTEGGAGT